MSDKIDLVAQIISAYVAHNSLPMADLATLIGSVNRAVTTLGQPIAPPPPEPAVAIRSSVRSDGIACLECGVRFKTLKRHLNTEHQLTIDQYRAKWALPWDYPTIAQDYSAARSGLAKRLGLGRKSGTNKVS